MNKSRSELTLCWYKLIWAVLKKFPDYVVKLSMEKIVLGVKNKALQEYTIKIFDLIADQRKVLPDGILFKLAQEDNLEAVCKVVDKFAQFMEFSQEDEAWKYFPRIVNKKKVSDEKELRQFLKCKKF